MDALKAITVGLFAALAVGEAVESGVDALIDLGGTGPLSTGNGGNSGIGYSDSYRNDTSSSSFSDTQVGYLVGRLTSD
ncbi:MAG: hypothetical protein FWB80_09235 [Defluviitaleaceae bacterium]|nr:hypothetical protein [Defluviitaleaceae bacterium]